MRNKQFCKVCKVELIKAKERHLGLCERHDLP